MDDYTLVKDSVLEPPRMRQVSGQMCALDCDKWSKLSDKDKHCARMSEARE